MSVEISFANLAVAGYGERLPLSLLDLDENSHIHAKLRFQIGNRVVPYMGFFGPDDVCFNTWISEFERIVKIFDSATDATYIFDEGEQSQPAYFFEKKNGTVYLSIIDSKISDGKADPQWQRVEFNYMEFKQQYLAFRELFISEIKKAAPAVENKWVERFL